MFHNNWVRGLLYKNLRSKEMGKYYLDIDGEYSSLTAKYFTTFTMNIKKNTSSGTSQQLKQYLNEVIKISNSLERVFVIPPLFCNRGKFGYCNICYYDFLNCFKSILDKLKNGFRESVLFYF